MKFGIGSFSPDPLPTLEILTGVLINRLRSRDTRRIRYLSIPKLKCKNLDALTLFVPEVHFVSSRR